MMYRHKQSRITDTDIPLYKKWRKTILDRDGKICQMPNCGSKTRLNAHHIRKWAHYPSIRFNSDNGITLCCACHKKTMGNEESYAQLFISIVNRNKNK